MTLSNAGGCRVRRLLDARLASMQVAIRRQSVPNAEVAKRAGTSRTRVTAILNDDLDHVSSDLHPSADLNAGWITYIGGALSPITIRSTRC